MKGLEEIERQKHLTEEFDKSNQRGFIFRLVLFILELVFWLPLLIYRKAKSQPHPLPNQ
jgi:hypothetical protein